jgi:CRP/FNR family transcriptional regulator, dissimilatory nitrate respiration regulator
MTLADWSILRSTAFFRAMPPEDARSLIGNQSVRTYPKGATLFRQGEPAIAFFVILDGWVKLYRVTADGLEVVLNVFKTGETFAEVAMFLGGRYPASAETASAARLLRIEAAIFRARIKERPEPALSMLASASRQLRTLIAQIEQIKVRSAPQRIAEFIIELVPKSESGAVAIEFPFEKSLLANRLGMKPESFSRALGKLKAHGVTVEKETATIADPGRLRQFVEYAGEGDED